MTRNDALRILEGSGLLFRQGVPPHASYLSPKLKQAQRRGIASNKANADELCTNVLPVIQQIKASGATSLRAIAKALTSSCPVRQLLDPDQCRPPFLDDFQR